eukprot:5541546-Lingulodinium_polyedra.AAC.1
MLRATASVLKEAFGVAPAPLAKGLAAWIEARTRIQHGLGGIRQWQWPFLLQCWRMEQAGMRRALASDA